MTQQDEIKTMLEKGGWRCGAEFLQAYLPEYRSLINKLRKAGYVIEARRCENKAHHHKGGMQEWRLSTSEDLIVNRLSTGFCCGDTLKGLRTHSLDCPTLKVDNQINKINQLF